MIPRRFASAALFILFFASCGDTSSGAETPPPGAMDENLPPGLADRDEWMGIYLGENKIGWSHVELRHDDSGHFTLSNESLMRITALGVPQESEIDLSVRFDRELEPLGYAFSLSTPSFSTEAEGEVGDGVLTTTLRTNGRETRREIPIEGRDIFGLSDLRLSMEGYEVGRVIEGELFEPNLFQMVPYRIEVVDETEIRSGESADTVFVVNSMVGEMETRSWVYPDGRLLRSEGPMGITARRETMESAMDLSGEGNVTDLFLFFAVPAGADVHDPASVRRAVMRVRGVPEGWRGLDGGVQSAADPDSEGWIRLTVDIDSNIPDPASPEEFSGPTTFIQSDDTRIIATAREIVGPAEGAEAARRINDWVYQYLDKVPSFTIPSALDVLDAGYGDCNEHSALFTGLARATGIPTRVAAGVVYLNGNFFYHAWPEVWIEGRWIPADPTFRQFPANALRIRFSAGELDEQVRIARVAGNLEIDLEEWE